jgi:hypothetical protein
MARPSDIADKPAGASTQTPDDGASRAARGPEVGPALEVDAAYPRANTQEPHGRRARRGGVYTRKEFDDDTIR